jgi:hypothetical protein
MQSSLTFNPAAFAHFLASLGVTGASKMRERNRGILSHHVIIITRGSLIPLQADGELWSSDAN